jgi:hypothetical protein
MFIGARNVGALCARRREFWSTWNMTAEEIREYGRTHELLARVASRFRSDT